MTDLQVLIDLVHTRKEAGDWSYGQQDATGRALALELEAEHGARFRTDREPMRMTMAGVRASSTGGWPGLLGNWVTAARRRLPVEGASRG